MMKMTGCSCLRDGDGPVKNDPECTYHGPQYPGQQCCVECGHVANVLGCQTWACSVCGCVQAVVTS